MTKEDFLNSIKPRPALVSNEYTYESRYSFMIEVAQKLCPEFEITDHNRKLYQEGLKYFSGDAESKFPLNKGLLLYGPTGTGKSFFFKVMSFVNNGCKTGNEFVSLPVEKLNSGFAQSGYEYFSISGIDFDPLNRYRLSLNSFHFLLDDFGLLESVVNFYGSNVDLVLSFIQRRYSCFVDNSILTHLTTNIKPEMFRERYGDAVASRINQMFTYVPLLGSDYRK